MGYQPFLVAPQSTGISTYLKPWMQPEDALTEMEDCFVYRGVIQKRYGYSLYDVFPSGIGLLQFGTGDGTTTAFNGTLGFASAGTPIGRQSLSISHTAGGVLITDGIDDGAGNITGTNIAPGSTINYNSGAVVINFTIAPDNATGIRINFGIKVATGDGSSGPYAFTLPVAAPFGLPIGKRSLFIRDTVSNQNTATVDAPANDGLTGSLIGNQATAGKITYATGGVSALTFNNPIALGDDIWARWQFTADPSPIKGIKFFWTSTSTQDTLVFNNKQAARFNSSNFNLQNITGSDFWNTDFNGFFSVANYLGKAYIINNHDRLAAWDGTFLTQPVVSFTSSTPTTNELTTGLHVVIYKNRLIILRPTENSVVKPQRARYSALNNPNVWFSDVQGKGGFIDAPTPEWIVGYEFIRDDLIVHFQDSTWRLRYTAVDVAPYRWEKINQTRRVTAPYSSVGYQNFDTTFGATGLIRCDGVNIERYDDKIIDFTEEEVDQDNADIINGYRFDQRNQQLLCYRSQTIIDSSIDYCDKWLVWNFLENSFAIFNIPSTTFGAYYQSRDLAWQDFIAGKGFVHPGSNPPTDLQWDDLQNQNWLSYFSQGSAQIPVFGTEDGEIMQLFPSFATDNGTKTGFTFTTKDFNPFVKAGKRAQLGFVDFYFDRPESMDVPDPNYNLTIDFYIDESDVPVVSTILNPSEDNFQKKRVYVNVTAQFHRFRIYLSDSQIQNSTVTTQGFVLNGFILYMSPTGRLIG